MKLPQNVPAAAADDDDEDKILVPFPSVQWCLTENEFQNNAYYTKY